MSADERLTILWNQIVRQVKAQGELNPPLWRALDSAVPIVIEGTTVVVGFDTHHQPDARFLELPGNQSLLSGVLGKVATKPLTLTIVDGTTMEEYEHYKARLAAIAELNARTRNTPAHQQPVDTGPFHEAHTASNSGQRLLSELQRRLHQRFVETDHHNLTLIKAQWLREVLPDLVEAEKQLALIEPHHEQFARHWSRALERIAEIVDADAVTFTVMYLRYKDHGTL